MKEPLSKRILIWIFENIWQLSIIIAATYTIIQYQRQQIHPDELLVWLVAIIELMAISGLIERNRRLTAIEKSILNLQTQNRIPGVYCVYEDRTGLPSIVQDLESVHQELFIVGLALGSLTLTYADILKKLAMRRCKVRILMLAPTVNGQANPIIREISSNLNFNAETYTHDIQNSLDRLVAMRASIPKDRQKNIEIKVYSCVPTFVIMAFDANGPSGKVRVDIIPYQVSRSLWPAFEFRFDKQSKLYNFYYESAEKLWDSKDAHEYISTQQIQ